MNKSRSKVEVLGRCGPAKHFKAANVLITKYPHDGSTALVSDPGTPDQQMYSVCLYAPPAPLQEGHVWLKGWGGAQGAPEALEDAGLVELTGATWPTGYVHAQEARLLCQHDWGFVKDWEGDETVPNGTRDRSHWACSKCDETSDEVPEGVDVDY